MKKITISLFIIAFISSPLSTNAGFFDFLKKENQTAQVSVSLDKKIATDYKKGDKNLTILEAQTILTKLGFYDGSISGLIGPKTEEAIKKYQSINGLKVTGSLDKETLNLLFNRETDNREGLSTLTAKVFLGGSYDPVTGLMSTALNDANLIPQMEPYDDDGYYGGNGEEIDQMAQVMAVTGDNAIVDWVLIGVTQDPFILGYSRSALVQADGDIVDVDGVSPVSLEIPSDMYFVSVYHRNHLQVMTSTLVDISQPVDFTTIPLYGENPAKIINGLQVLWPGDVDFNQEISYTGGLNDRDPILLAIGGTVPTNTISGYRAEDLNMDGVVKYTGVNNDKDIILQSIGVDNINNEIITQMPYLVSCLVPELVDASAEVFGNNNFGFFQMKFDLTATCDDVYISPNTELNDNVDTIDQGISFGIVTPNQGVTYNTSATIYNITDDDLTLNGNWRIEEGETERIELTVLVTPTQGSSFYRLNLDSINWSLNDGPNSNFFDLNLAGNIGSLSIFKTPYISLTN